MKSVCESVSEIDAFGLDDGLDQFSALIELTVGSARLLDLCESDPKAFNCESPDFALASCGEMTWTVHTAGPGRMVRTRGKSVSCSHRIFSSTLQTAS